MEVTGVECDQKATVKQQVKVMTLMIVYSISKREPGLLLYSVLHPFPEQWELSFRTIGVMVPSFWP